MTTDLKDLRIARSGETTSPRHTAVAKWIAAVLGVAALVGVGSLLHANLTTTTVPTAPAETPPQVSSSAPPVPSRVESGIILNATGYIVAAHYIELASKVVGRVAWIGVEKGDKVRGRQELVRLEDEEYRAQLMQARGQLDSVRAKLAELENGPRTEEILKSKADLEQARADLENLRGALGRTRELARNGIMARQSLDDAQAKYDAASARFASLERTYELVRLGPRREQIEAARAQVTQAQGAVDYARTQVDNTVIRAPLAGTILKRNVEKGEFVTTGFVGERGAKGYVVSLANLDELQVELDINQVDFAKLSPRQPAFITTDAYPDRKYEGFIEEISPEANRQKATVQLKVRILNPDHVLRPEMNASVAFYSPKTAAHSPDLAKIQKVSLK